MDKYFKIPKKFNYITFGLMGLGLVGFAYGFLTDSHRTWGNLLVSNYYFLSLAIGAVFFYCLQYITQSGWSALFGRVPEAIMSFLPYSGILMLIFFWGLHDIYPWSNPGIVADDSLLTHKSIYLNVPFFMFRIILVYAAWILLTWKLRKLSLQEDNLAGLIIFEKLEFWSKVFIFVMAITFSAGTFDWIMSIDKHWFSTIFAFKNFASAFYHGTCLIVLVVIILHKKGYFKELNEYHLLDFSRYLFMLSIIWGYLNFVQFMLIWYGNIPEETIYYANRWNHGWLIFLLFNFIVNWFIPFLVLLPQKFDKNIHVVYGMCILLLVGLYTEIFEQVMPDVTVSPRFGLTEIGVFAGLAGVFLYIGAKALAKAPLVPANHPYLEESIHHHIH